MSLFVVTIGAPLFIIPAILIKRESPGPVFFLQTRIGKDGKPFRMIKFRTMHLHLSGDAPKPKGPEDPRIRAEMIEYPSPGGSGVMRGYLARPDGPPTPRPAVLVIHENRGLNPYIEDVVRRFSAEGSGKRKERRKPTR